MSFKDLGDLNNKHFLRGAFDKKTREKLLRFARFRRNVYLALFIIGFICIFITGFSDRLPLSIMSLFLATLSLVVMTKYDTQVFFLNIISEKDVVQNRASGSS